jgi:mannose/fructose/N-acetylgalactosamine-specific phosphotransferase system component IID
MKLAILNTFFRSFFLQTLWNFERMQNVGFAFTLAPLLKRVYGSPESYRLALRKHLGFFNTHPYFGTLIVGTVYHREVARAGDANSPDATVTVLKDSMGAAFGGIGDHVLWGTWRPFCAILALSIGLLVAYPLTGGTPTPSLFNAEASMVCAKWWVAGFLGLFNAIHLWLRWRGLQKSVNQGPLVVRWVQSLNLQTWASQIRRMGLLLLAVMVLVYLSRWTSSDMLLWMVAVLLGTVIMKRWALSGTAIFYAVCLVSGTMTVAGIHWP